MDYKRYLEQNNGWKNGPIWICGLDVISFGVIRWLEREGYAIAGILDHGFAEDTPLYGTVICPATKISDLPENAFFIITAFQEREQKKYERMILERYGENVYLIIANPTEIRIDVSGVCNLRCPSCQIANHSKEEFRYAGRGFMGPELFERLLKKLDLEIPDIPAVYLFTLGEPLLNRNLPKLVHLIHQHGWLAVISSNLSLHTDLEALVESEPDVFKISVSGFTQNVYGSTHVGGDVELAKENMRTLHRLIVRKRKKIHVVVGYHLYNNNRTEELAQMRDFCKKLGFLLQPVEAMYFNMLKRSGHTAFTEADIAFIQSYYSDPEKILYAACPEAEPHQGVACRNLCDKLFLDYDGTVMLCELFHQEGFYKNYLDITIEEIQRWRQEHWICKRCIRYGMHLK